MRFCNQRDLKQIILILLFYNYAGFMKSSSTVQYADIGVQYNARELMTKSCSERRLSSTDHYRLRDCNKQANWLTCRQLSSVSVHVPSATITTNLQQIDNVVSTTSATDGGDSATRQVATGNCVTHP